MKLRKLLNNEDYAVKEVLSFGFDVPLAYHLYRYDAADETVNAVEHGVFYGREVVGCKKLVHFKVFRPFLRLRENIKQTDFKLRAYIKEYLLSIKSGNSAGRIKARYCLHLFCSFVHCVSRTKEIKAFLVLVVLAVFEPPVKNISCCHNTLLFYRRSPGLQGAASVAVHFANLCPEKHMGLSKQTDIPPSE